MTVACHYVHLRSCSYKVEVMVQTPREISNSRPFQDFLKRNKSWILVCASIRVTKISICNTIKNIMPVVYYENHVEHTSSFHGLRHNVR